MTKKTTESIENTKKEMLDELSEVSQDEQSVLEEHASGGAGGIASCCNQVEK